MPSFFQSKITTVALSILCLWLLLVAVGAGTRHASTARELANVHGRIQSGERDNARLAQELERMKEPAWLALIARERLNYKKPDETVVFVYKSDVSATIQPVVPQDDTPNWRKWLRWLQGK